MERFPKARCIILLLFSAATAVLGACKGVGMFAFIAVSDRIDESRLPKGTSASKVVQIKNEFTSSKYAYFSSGSTLYRKNMANRASKSAVWSTVPLPSGWTNIQSMAASDDRLLLALAKESGGILTVGLFYYSNTQGFRPVDGTPFTGDKDSYPTLRVFAPNPSDPFYVNVLHHKGSFGQNDAEFSRSEMHTLPGNGSAGSWRNRGDAGTEWTKTLKNRYVSSAAWSEEATLFSTVNPDDTTGGGALAGSDGAIVDTKIKRAISGLTWLPHVKAFIMCTTAASGGNYTVYVNEEADGTGKWTAKDVNSRFESFLDITETAGGGKFTGSTELVLAGTHSVGPTQGTGYMEIDVSSGDPTKWAIRTDRGGFTFADITNYESGELVQSSVPSFSLFEGYVYASTRGKGIWSIDANAYTGTSSRPKWSSE